MPPHTAGAARPWNLNRDSERPLRLGFVSADFRRHPVGFFLAPVLEHLDPLSRGRLLPQPARLRRPHPPDCGRAKEWHDVFRLDDDCAR